MLSTLGVVFLFGTLQPIFAASNELTEKAKEKSTVVTDASDKLLNDAVVQDAMTEFKSLSRVEKKHRMSEVKKLAKHFKAEKAQGKSESTLLLAILAILLPPLAVALHEDGINGKFWISLLLTLLFWIPGVIYALIVVL